MSSAHHSFPPDGIVALHGNLGSAEDWSGIDLQAGRALNLWDHTGNSLAEMADAVAGELSRDFRSPILAGYSMGGRIALHALARHPDRWCGAILLAAHPGLMDAEARRERRATDQIWAERARSWEWERFLALWNAQGVLGPPSPALFQRQLALESNREHIASAFENWSLGCQENLREALVAFRRPVLWIVGEKDSRFLNLGREMTNVFEHVQLYELPGEGHRVLDANESNSHLLPQVIEKWCRTVFIDVD